MRRSWRKALRAADRVAAAKTARQRARAVSAWASMVREAIRGSDYEAAGVQVRDVPAGRSGADVDPSIHGVVPGENAGEDADGAARGGDEIEIARAEVVA